MTDAMNLLLLSVKEPQFSCLVDIGLIRHGFTWAFYLLLKGLGYREAIEAILKQGGDTDTNAAIVGGLIGAAVGESGIPRNMAESVLKRNATGYIKKYIFYLEANAKASTSRASHRPEWLFPGYFFEHVYPKLVAGIPGPRPLKEPLPPSKQRPKPVLALAPPPKIVEEKKEAKKEQKKNVETVPKSSSGCCLIL